MFNSKAIIAKSDDSDHFIPRIDMGMLGCHRPSTSQPNSKNDQAAGSSSLPCSNTSIARHSHLRHHFKTLPTARRSRSASRKPVFLLSIVLILLLCFSQTVVAQSSYHENSSSLVLRMWERGAHLVGFEAYGQPLELKKRQDDDGSSSSDEDEDDDEDATATAATSTSPLRSPPPIEPVSTGLPRPFDGVIGNNYTDTACPNFLREMLDDPEFNDCVPLSMLYQNSDDWFQVQKSLVRTTQVLDASCNVDFENCRAVMDGFAIRLEEDAVCGDHLERRQPQVLRAYNGLLAYPQVYNTGCLENSDGEYCFAVAATDNDLFEDTYPFLLPIGQFLPGGSRQTCNECLQGIMTTFANAASNATLPISETYNEAAQQLNLACGQDFAVTNVEVEGSASRSMILQSTLFAASCAATVLISLAIL